MPSVSNIISSKAGADEILNTLAQLPGTELNSILLELFNRRTANITAAEVLAQFNNNRFVAPSTLDVINFKQLELEWLTQAAQQGFQPVMLSPLAPLGTCSSFKTIHQNNVVTALRGTEVMSDATNVFALLMAQQYKQTKSTKPVKYIAAERLVRAQGLSHPGHTAHFGIFCIATGGFNKGNFSFETEQLAEHINVHLALLSSFNKKDLSVKILLKESNENLRAAVQAALAEISNQYAANIIVQDEPNAYYNLLQFKTFLHHNGNEINLSDGGFTNWTQQLLGNKKHRMLISGIGIELVYKLMKGLI